MNGRGHEFLASTTLAAHQHRNGTWGNLADQGHDLPHGGTITDDAFKSESSIKFALQAAVLVTQHHRLGGTLH